MHTDEDSPDLVTKIFGKLFGQAALEEREPGGLKRLSDEALQELYPATTTEFAEPVASDDADMACFRPLLAKTQLERAELRLAYDANVQGWTPEAFHRCVDTFGAAVVLCRTQGGAVCGGYNPKGWVGLGDNRDSNAAFLFTWPDGDTSQPAAKLPKVGGAGLAVLDKADSGPQFGPEGLHIPLAAAAPRLARSRLGAYYAKLQGGGRTVFAAGDDEAAAAAAGGRRARGVSQAELTDLKVYVRIGEGEEWKLDGILWKTSVKEGQ